MDLHSTHHKMRTEEVGWGGRVGGGGVGWGRVGKWVGEWEGGVGESRGWGEVRLRGGGTLTKRIMYLGRHRGKARDVVPEDYLVEEGEGGKALTF